MSEAPKDHENHYVAPILQETKTPMDNSTREKIDDDAQEKTQTVMNAITDATNKTANASDPPPPVPFEQEQLTRNNNEKGGVHLPQLAGEQIQHHPQTNKNSNQWAETFKARTRSCANPNATTASTTATTNIDPSSTTVNPPPPDLVSVALPAHQLVFPNRDVLPVAQLLILGMVGILVGWLGNAVVGTSCYFASVNVTVQQKEKEMHFGLYKYSSADNGSNGYEYCVPYSGSYAKQAPFVARTMNVLAFFFGTMTLMVLWWTLVMGSSLVRPSLWMWSSRAAIMAGLCQLTTLSFYAEAICRQHTCHLGPASYLNGIVAVVWFGIAREMRLRSPHRTSDDNASHLLETDPICGDIGNNKAALELPERGSTYEPPGVC
ncbi:hypothetical protein FisN_19Lh021 [Fistulifera solaris]|uniref:Uncharacterized protein n=1 Tax=Fistulifera solaris TaxID=1519565 RepID=A0A1Z5JQZ3_FISSO|nr:hypothetical protein FisN_19Lh021 [Fistulifera solaris]|eukprot:GAX16443.1 hypothetical protein FisN_19Lh021 [Fistulifera solaris]